MKKHKRDRYESPQLKRRKNKAKKRKKEKKLKKSYLLSSDNILSKKSDYSSTPKRIKQVDVKINQHSNQKNISEEVSYILKKHSITKKQNNILPLNIKEHFNSSNSNKLSLQKCDRVKIANNVLNSNFIPHLSKQEKSFSISKENRTCSIIRKVNKSRSRSKCRSRSISRSNFNLYCCKHKSNNNKRRSTSCDKHNLKKKIISYKYKNSASPNKLFKVSYSKKNSISPEINFKDNNSKIPEKSNYRTKFNSRQVMLSYSPLQKHYDRYIDILREVKKILKKDAISKRKLKYILKRQRIYVRAPYIKLQSSSEDDFYIRKNDSKHNNIENEIIQNSFNYFHNDLTTKTPRKMCTSPANSVIQENNDLCKRNSLFSEKLIPSTFITNVNIQSNERNKISSPVCPLIRDETEFNKNFNKTKLNQLSLKKIHISDKSTKLNSKVCDNYKNINKFSKYLTVENNFLNTSDQTNDSFNSLKSLNPCFCEKNNSLDFSNKNDINVQKTISFYRLSSSSQSTSISRSLTPFRNSSNSRPWPQIFVLQNKTSNLVVKEDIKYPKRNKKVLSQSIQSSPSKNSSISELSRSRTPNLKSCLETLHSNCRTRSRSISISKTSRSLSCSNSRNSIATSRRSCSKDSSHTFISSTRYSNSSYSCSSRSTTFSSRISRPDSSNSTRSRSTSIPRRYGSPSFLDRRRITSARKRPIPYHRPTPSPLSSTSSIDRSSCSGWSPKTNKSSRTPSCSSPYLIS